MPSVESPRPTSAGIPAPAAWLGAAGALPFLAAVVLVLAAGPETGAWAALAVRAYGAVILSFMGGIHWGLAMAQGGTSWARLGLAVLPALLGWMALLLPLPFGLPLLAAAFAVLLAGDLQAVRAGLAPGWYPRLRWPLSAVVILCLFIAAL